MIRARHLVLFAVLFTALIWPASSGPVLSSSSSCPEIVQQAWSTTEIVCEVVERNQACYGHIRLEAQPQPYVTRFQFDTEGQVVPVADLLSLRLSTMDTSAGTWGVALMKLQAGLPDNQPTQNVTLILFGDVALRNAEPATVQLPVQPVESIGSMNVRAFPSTQAAILGVFGIGEELQATGRLSDGSWLRVEWPETGGGGWVYAGLVTSTGDLDSLPVIEAGAPAYGPLQAFTFQSAADDAQCSEAANSGMIIQTPEGAGKVTFLINEISIQLGSTLYFQAQPGGFLTASVLEGAATITAFDTARMATAGSQITVPLGEDGQVAGPPNDPQSYDMAAFHGMPLGMLERAITIHAPLTAEELAALLEAQPEFPPGILDNPGLDGAIPPGLIDNPGVGDSLPPGLIDNPGLGDSLPPGQGGNPPGQDKKDK
jgi:hypothetical protein